MLLLPFLTMDWVSMDGVFGIAIWLGLVVLLFGSVLLHELGHALTARKFGIQTQDIVLTPIGGMARVLMMPANPRQEIAIAIAGPLVSLALAGAAFAATIPLSFVPFVPDAIYMGLFVLTGANLMLGLFNLVPALPMDGGRVLRGILALKRDFLSATRIAVRTGRVLAVIGGIYAVSTGRWTLGLIAVFIYMVAGNELRMAELRAFQERTGNPPGSPGVTWRWTHRTGVDYPRPAGSGPGTETTDWGPGRARADRDVVVVGGKARVTSRKDPDPEQ
jgi:Zn-dependent protease